MSIYLGNTEIGQIYLGNTEIATAYLGSTKVYEAGSPSPLPYDAKVEYLAASGTQRIHTGITGNARFTGSAQANTIKGSSQLVLCGRADATGVCFFGEVGTTRKWSIGTDTGHSTITPTTKVSFDLNFDNSGAFGTIGTDSVTRSGNTTKK